jgi:hypothetical protein
MRDGLAGPTMFTLIGGTPTRPASPTRRGNTEIVNFLRSLASQPPVVTGQPPVVTGQQDPATASYVPA